MDLILAMDLKSGLVVHGMKGDRASYRPLDWGLSPTADPAGYVEAIAPRFLYIADLDRIARTGDHDREVIRCASMVDTCYVDRGVSCPGEFIEGDTIINVVGTETAGDDLSVYGSGFLSIDVKDGRVIPGGLDPTVLLERAEDWAFDGCIILDISAVGTGSGIDAGKLERLRSAYGRSLYYGGGVSGTRDLSVLEESGFDGAIVATALHRGRIPAESIRRGEWS
ncbi:MAG: nickel transporter [Methanoregulaceae archaeon]|jgi:phosphoribosylformimino-5-aminoimidazole carboxamide ribotide isomerase|nr:nickel transporter [Methanolinea sp.]MCC7566957.1 nickel transporter [Methanoregulaceae archaeon]